MENETTVRKILVPVDGSETCQIAQETAALLAKKAKAKVTVLHVIQSTRSYLDWPVDMNQPTEYYDDVYASLEQQAETVVNSAEELFKSEGVSVETETVKEGDVADVILKRASDGYELAVIGGRGEDEKDPTILGSVAKKVVMHAVVPTLIVKKPSQLSNLLVCVDGSDRSEKALGFAAAIAGMMGSKVTLLNVQKSLLGEKSPEMAQVSQKIFSKVMKSMPRTELKLESRVVFGVPSNKIVETADKGDYDLIVLGKRGLGTVTRFLMGSTSDAVTYKAKCSVLLIPE